MSQANGYTIGVDGGGTSCRVAIASPDGCVLGRAEGGVANVATSLDLALKNVRDALDAARREAGLDESELKSARIHLGLAGMNDALTKTVAAAFPFRSVAVTDDRPIAMAGALGSADGFVAAIGTGSFVGRQTRGRLQFVGGWGFHVGDQASGAWLGRKLLTQVLEWHDGLRPPAGLLERTFSDFRGDPSRIDAFSFEAQPADYATFAPSIVSAARNGDDVATAMMRDGAAYIERGLSALGFETGAPLCMIGGLGPHYVPWLSPRFTGNLVDPKGTALDGALSLAARLEAPNPEHAT